MKEGVKRAVKSWTDKPGAEIVLLQGVHSPSFPLTDNIVSSIIKEVADPDQTVLTMLRTLSKLRVALLTPRILTHSNPAPRASQIHSKALALALKASPPSIQSPPPFQPTSGRQPPAALK